MSDLHKTEIRNDSDKYVLLENILLHTLVQNYDL